LNILLIHQNFLETSEGGGSRFNEMTRIWAEAGHTVTVIAGMVHYTSGKKNPIYKGKFLLTEKISDKISVIRCHVSEAYNVSFLGRLWAYFSFVFSSIFAGIISLKIKPDIVLATSPPLFVGITGFILSKIKRKPLIFEVRDLWPESAIDTGVLSNKFLIKLSLLFEQFIYSYSHKINVLTPAFREVLITKKKIPESKIIFIPNAADFKIVDRIMNNFNRDMFRSEHGFDRKTVIIYVGAHGIANHLIQMIDAADLLQGTNTLFISIGAGMQQQYLRDEVVKRNLCNIKFLDPVSKEEVFKYILASDIGVSILKKVDTFKTVYSNKTFDYMSCKKPILMAIDGVSRQLVEDSKCGFFIEPENPNNFVDKVLYYLKYPNQMIEHGNNGYIYARKHFDREILANNYLEEIKKLV
jgi:glycosyltransferase involved in cell wall biosynthesis